MRAKDYKNAAAKPKAKERPVGSWVSFVSGLAIGLVVALSVYFWRGEYPAPVGAEPANTATEVDEPASFSNSEFEAQLARELPERKFDFYKILPEIEVKVPDWEISSATGKQNSEFKQGTYVLQVGSFKQYQDADRAKAQLALRGIQAKIHRVVINGQDVWYRVHVGPYTDLEGIRTMRARLIESGNDYILLKIGDAAG
ncbi:MAG: SPOR domain-containing protein [Gammaproteobacteria bacterium]|jgi:cell division protein FtsN|nr:SPOR domain-containing protein [Gammaproteobacteria bacterium]